MDDGNVFRMLRKVEVLKCGGRCDVRRGEVEVRPARRSKGEDGCREGGRDGRMVV